MVHEAGEQLHRHVLEGERRPVKKLQYVGIAGKVPERRDRRIAEVAYASRHILRRSASGIAPPMNGRMISKATSA
jgi:hypothetical protein